MKRCVLIIIALLMLVSCSRDENYYKECGSKVFRNSTDIYYPNEEVFYLGEYNDYHFVILHNYHNQYKHGFHKPNNYKKIEMIYGIEFIYYCDSFHIFGYKSKNDKTMLELKDAYTLGIITYDDLVSIKANIDKLDFTSEYGKFTD